MLRRSSQASGQPSHKNVVDSQFDKDFQKPAESVSQPSLADNSKGEHSKEEKKEVIATIEEQNEDYERPGSKLKVGQIVEQSESSKFIEPSRQLTPQKSRSNHSS